MNTVLPWHREAAKELYAMNRGWSATYENFETVIARHDPHAAQHIENVQMSELWAQNELLLQRNAETLRLLEEAKEYLHELRGEWSWKHNTSQRNTNALADLDATIDAIRAHLAAMKGTQP